MSKGDYVILLHGLGRSSNSMKEIERYLSKRDFQVINVNYPSTKMKIVELVYQYLDPIIKKCNDDTVKLHFVTHSMGGILVRYYFKKNMPKNLGRVIMLAPPNQGSEVTDWLRNFFLYKWVLGPAGQELGTDINSVPNQLGEVKFELGVIAGNKSMNWLYSRKIPGPNDGKVAVARTKVEGMKDFLVLPKNHTWIMRSRDVFFQVDHFLQKGVFNKEKEVL